MIFHVFQSRSESGSGVRKGSPVKIVPEGRRLVKVVLLNGRQVPFVVEVYTTALKKFSSL